MTLDDLLKQVLFLDLEADRTGGIHQIGAVLGDKVFEKKQVVTRTQLQELDRFAECARFILGHNLIEHDFPILRSKAPDLALLRKPIIDTLFISPLAFPQNPYHRLVKDYKLVRDSINDPVADARLAASVFRDQVHSFGQIRIRDPELLSFYRFCFSDAKLSAQKDAEGIDLLFRMLGCRDVLHIDQASDLFRRMTAGLVCPNQVAPTLLPRLQDPETRPLLAYCLAWLKVAGGNSVLPPWVRHRFPQIVPVLKRLRDFPCDDPACPYCFEAHNPETVLEKYFCFDKFRDLPDGRPLQREIVAAGLRDQPLLGILPTGFGKSICFQLPALARFHRRGVLTIVISPLQALMKDQVDNLINRVKTNAVAAVNGLLSSPERGAVLEAVRLGDIGLLYISPEQLRNRSVREAVKQREIGAIVFDEAHCLSKWGHDFRPDYLYVSRFIREYANEQKIEAPPVTCVTATAKPEVIGEIQDHFKIALSQDLSLFSGGLERANLRFFVKTVNAFEKNSAIDQLLKGRLGNPPSGSAIVYFAKVKSAEEGAEYLCTNGWKAEAYHGRLPVPDKRRAQEAFVADEVNVICATNAFGMGIDKENVRLVIHADIPGSIENYLQEAGRAGRDNAQAECFLLYDENDVETQLGLTASSELRLRDIQQILRGLRRAKRNRNGEIVLTTGELLRDENVDTGFDSEDRSADTKVKNAISWLERGGFLERDENRTSVFSGKPLFKSMEEASLKMKKLNLHPQKERIWEAILQTLFNSAPDEGISADFLAEALGRIEGIDPEQISDTRKILQILHEMAESRLIQSGMMLSAYLRPKGSHNARWLLGTISEIDQAMIKVLREEHPNETVGEWLGLDIRRLNQKMVDSGTEGVNPEVLRRLMHSLSADGKGFAGRHGSLDLHHAYQDQYRVKLLRGWQEITAIAEKRRNLAFVLLNALYSRLPEKMLGTAEVLVDFSLEDLADALRRDLTVQVASDKMLAAIDRGLLFLHEHKIIILQKGLSVFRQAMTVRLLPEARGRRYAKGDYALLDQHYGQRIFQVHVMNEYARIGAAKISKALALVAAYFTMERHAFVRRFFPDRKKMLEMATSEASFRKIVEALGNPVQEAVVAGKTEENVLILAGPGSGKTRVVVHRCAFLLRVRRVPPKSILILCFNHNAALAVRRRLWELVKQDAAGVTVSTYHALAMRLTGTSFLAEAERGAREESEVAGRFQAVFQDAIDLLKGDKDLVGIAPDEIRERLLAGYQYILVDEYQDIDDIQYELISAIAGRTIQDQESKLTILAVGDDDQSIYGFRNANVRFIRRFQSDYEARVHHLVENYRSTHHIIAGSNSLIARNSDRMKTGHPIRINGARKDNPRGGRWESLDPVGRGQIQKLAVDDEAAQAEALVREIERLRSLDPKLEPGSVAVLARAGMKHGELSAVRSVLASRGIPFSFPMDRDAGFSIFRVREFSGYAKRLKERKGDICDARSLIDDFEASRSARPNPWEKEIRRLLQAWESETGNSPVFVQSFIDFFFESLAEQRREMRIGNGIFLGTAHGAKGMEFDHVFILDGGWRKEADRAKHEEERRLFYVAMTRARETLCVFQRADSFNPHIGLIREDHVLERKVSIPKEYLQEAANRAYSILGLKQLYIGYAGCRSEDSPVHEAIRSLRPGDRVSMKTDGNRILVQTAGGITVARLSRAACGEWHNKMEAIEEVRVLAIIERTDEDTTPEYADRVLCSRWEVPILEVVAKRIG